MADIPCSKIYEEIYIGPQYVLLTSVETGILIIALYVARAWFKTLTLPTIQGWFPSTK